MDKNISQSINESLKNFESKKEEFILAKNELTVSLDELHHEIEKLIVLKNEISEILESYDDNIVLSQHEKNTAETKRISTKNSKTLQKKSPAKNESSTVDTLPFVDDEVDELEKDLKNNSPIIDSLSDNELFESNDVDNIIF